MKIWSTEVGKNKYGCETHSCTGGIFESREVTDERDPPNLFTPVQVIFHWGSSKDYMEGVRVW